MANIEITPAGAVSSVFTRTGGIVAATGDYTAAQVTNAADKASASTQTFTGSIAVSASSGTVNVEAGRIIVGSRQGPGGTPSIEWLGNQDLYAPDGATLATQAAIRADGGFFTRAITSGALPTVSPVSATALQISTTRDVFLHQVCTFNPTAGAAATCAIALSPDNVTYSPLLTVTIPAGVSFDGTIPPIGVRVPAGWYVKFTTTNATLGTGTYY